ncbi:hypothetical protein Bca4012_064952 [Brassica carinata]
MKEGSKKMMKRPMKDLYGSDAAEGFNKGKMETVEHYRSLLRLSNEHRKSEVAWTEASGTLEKLTLEHAEAEVILGAMKVKIPDWDKLDEKWLLKE